MTTQDPNQDQPTSDQSPPSPRSTVTPSKSQEQLTSERIATLKKENT